MKSIFINGDSIHYIDIGKGGPVVLVHGGVGDYTALMGEDEQNIPTRESV